MRILLDECVDRRFARELSGYEVITVPQNGWAGIKNGSLMKLAAAEFDVFITVDRNLSFQQNMADHDIAVIVLRAVSNRYQDLAQYGEAVRDHLSSGPRGGTIFLCG